MSENSPLLRAEGLTKVFRSGEEEVVVFADLNFSIESGEMLAIVGESGCGKTTLLHLMAALDTPTRGALYFAEKALSELDANARAAFRSASVGFVWQMHHLLPEFTAIENVMLPQLAAGREAATARRRAMELLDEVGLEKLAARKAGELSGGEQQRVALARALANHPTLLLADEPTGNLDGRTAVRVMDLIERLHRNHGLTSVVATHNQELAARATRKLQLAGGQLQEAFVPKVP